MTGKTAVVTRIYTIKFSFLRGAFRLCVLLLAASLSVFCFLDLLCIPFAGVSPPLGYLVRTLNPKAG